MKQYFRDHKSRFYILVGIIPFIFLFVWKISLSASVDTYREVRELKARMENYPNPDSTIEVLKLEIENAMRFSNIDPEEVDEQIIQFVSRNGGSSRVHLEEFPTPICFVTSGYSIYRYDVSLSGAYKDLLKFQDLFCREMEYGELASLDFKLIKKRKQKDKLQMKMSFRIYAKL